ncbi:MAG: S-adenosylmethionine:tRNA ribosyltransferase-isomerase [Bacteroidales bacterium]
MSEKKSEIVKGLPMEAYTYSLPESQIAPWPLKERDASRMLVYADKQITDASFRQLDEFLNPETMLVLNNTRVVQARLEFFKATGARIEIFCLNPLSPEKEVQKALGQGSPVRWECLVGNLKKWKNGALEIRDSETGFWLRATLEGSREEGQQVCFQWNPADMSFGEVLEVAGMTPLPPYITRKAEERDKHTYQTVFAQDEGSVAAPTAGLHFTAGVFERLQKKGISVNYVTLHVGAGTFKPVTSETIGGHAMHEEQFLVETDFLQRLYGHQGPRACVGTTSMRTLESLYWLGALVTKGIKPAGEALYLPQWTPYEWEGELPVAREAIEALLQWARENDLSQIRGETALLITPGYHFRMTDILLTNFHQPGSTLLLLVAAFTGGDWRRIYNHALSRGYRFLSYGDSCLLFKAP